ncbi:MAG: glycosyltransferase family 4 protein [Acidimicrobiales bacterium]
MQPDPRLLLITAVTFGGAALLTPVARRVAVRRGITDRPGENKGHTVATPYLGGVAIAICVLAGSTLLPQWKAEAVVLVAAALLVGTIGLVDDLRTLGPLPRVAVEVVAASIVFAAGAQAQLGGPVVNYLVTVGWLVVMTNAFNLLDNMDGCAGIVAAVTATGLAVAALLEGQVLVGGLAVVVAAASVGFLLHNWHPARIFMGDAGSLFLGFLLSAIALKLRFPGSHFSSIAAVILLAGLALFDTTLVVLSRVMAHRPIQIGGVDHTSHRLQRLGMTPPLVALVLALGTGVFVTLGILVGRDLIPPMGVLPPVAVVAVVGWFLLLRVRVYDEPATALEGDGNPPVDIAVAAIVDGLSVEPT